MTGKGEFLEWQGQEGHEQAFPWANNSDWRGMGYITSFLVYGGGVTVKGGRVMA